MLAIDKSEILFIINPNSGNKNPEKIIRQIKKADPLISYVITKNTQDLEHVFLNNIEKFKAFVAVGGDGTVNEIIKYLLNKEDKVLGVLPNGSGNGFANELNFHANIKSLISDIVRGETLNIDVLEVNDYKCINIAGLGFDSHVAHLFHKKSRRGFKNYILSTFQSVFQFKPFHAVLNTSKAEVKGRFQMITIANTRQFGNHALISPRSKPNDGIFEIVLVKPFPFYFYPVFVIKMYLGTLKSSRYIHYLRETDFVSIESDYKKYHVDGEPYLTNGTLTINLGKNTIQIIKMSASKL